MEYVEEASVQLKCMGAFFSLLFLSTFVYNILDGFSIQKKKPPGGKKYAYDRMSFILSQRL